MIIDDSYFLVGENKVLPIALNKKNLKVKARFIKENIDRFAKIEKYIKDDVIIMSLLKKDSLKTIEEKLSKIQKRR